MTTIIFAVPVFVLAVAGLALGLIIRKRPLCGSCGHCSDCIMRKAGG